MRDDGDSLPGKLLPYQGEFFENAMSKEGDGLAATGWQVGVFTDPACGVDGISVFDLLPRERLPVAKVDLAESWAHVDLSVPSDCSRCLPGAEQVGGVNRIEGECVGAGAKTCDQVGELCLATIVERRIGGSTECPSQCDFGVSDEKKSEPHKGRVKDGDCLQR